MKQSKQFLNDHLKGATEVIDLGEYLSFKRVPSATEPKHGHSFMATDAASQGSGVRLDFETSATRIELALAFDAVIFPGQPTKPVQIVVEVGEKIEHHALGNLRYLGFPEFKPQGQLNFENLEIDLGEHSAPIRVQVWFPHNAITYISKLELNGVAQKHVSNQAKWVHYGSSISHGADADYPIGVWPVHAARKLELDVVNLGLGGNALVDPYMAQVILDHNPECLSMKLGINSINSAGHILRTFIPAVYGLIDALLEKKPDLKILLISPIFCPPHEDGFGPTIFDMQNIKATANPNPAFEMFPTHLNTKRVRHALEEIVQNFQGKGVNIRYLNGLDLMGEADTHLLEDDLHPNSQGQTTIGERFAKHPQVASWLAG